MAKKNRLYRAVLQKMRHPIGWAALQNYISWIRAIRIVLKRPMVIPKLQAMNRRTMSENWILSSKKLRNCTPRGNRCKMRMARSVTFNGATLPYCAVLSQGGELVPQQLCAKPVFQPLLMNEMATLRHKKFNCSCPCYKLSTIQSKICRWLPYCTLDSQVLMQMNQGRCALPVMGLYGLLCLFTQNRSKTIACCNSSIISSVGAHYLAVMVWLIYCGIFMKLQTI